ncbi:MAG: hypothetical protein Q9224_007554 [Gallowayella concinna]
MAPCMLILEDIDTIVTPSSRSYFFNEVDGLENNDGIFMVASTNHLDRLDPGLSSRPSRFDRKYLFPLPSTEERELYCEYWRRKLRSKPSIEYPLILCPAIASITNDFSFAYLQEAFVATLLAIAGHRSEGDGFSILGGASHELAIRGDGGHKLSIRHGNHDDSTIHGGGDHNNLNTYELWREMKRQVKALRDDMSNSTTTLPPSPSPSPSSPSSPPSSPPSSHQYLPIRTHDTTTPSQSTDKQEAIRFDRNGNAVSQTFVGVKKRVKDGGCVKDGKDGMDGMAVMGGNLPMWDCEGKMIGF